MDEDALAEARRSLHAVAELVLAGPQYRASGRIRLRVIPGGFATAFQPDVRVRGLRVTAGDSLSAISGQTARTLGERLGITAGKPEGAYQDGAGAGIDEPLELDSDHAAAILDALALGNDALAAFASAEMPVLWPEHFDVAIRVDDVNYGVSPGDGYIAAPYAYVGVDRTPEGDAFWNASFGAARPLRDLDGLGGTVTFFTEGRERARRLQGAEIFGNCSRVCRVGDQTNVSVRADEDQGVGAVRAGHVPVLVEEAAPPDKVGLNDARFPKATLAKATLAQAEQGEVRPTEEIEEPGRRTGDGVAQRRVRCPVAWSGSGGSAGGLAG